MKDLRENIIADFLKKNRGKAVKNESVMNMFGEFVNFGEMRTCFDSSNYKGDAVMGAVQKDMNNKHFKALKLMMFINDRDYIINMDMKPLRTGSGFVGSSMRTEYLYSIKQ